MQFIYVLTNVHVHNLVKFGFSTREPEERAAELSAPTGVPGRWIVHHYWEVEDGYGVEQAIFKRLSKHRLERQEFFHLTADEAVKAITRALNAVGTNPTEKAREVEEAKVTHLAYLKRVENLKAEKLEKKRQQKKLIHDQIFQAQALVRTAEDRREKKVFWVIFIIGLLYWLDKNQSMLNSGTTTGVTADLLRGGAMLVFSSVAAGITAVIGQVVFDVVFKGSSNFDAQCEKIKMNVLAKHGLKALEDLD